MRGFFRFLPLLAFGGTGACADVKKDRSTYQAPNVTTQSSAAASQPLPDTLPRPLLDTLRFILRQRNPTIEQVAFPQIQWFGYGRGYVAIGWGVRADQRFSGSMNDELYSILLLDSTLTRVRHVLDIVPSPRWLDYRFRIEELTGDSIIITGRGDTYGDGPTRRAYPWP
jgi:hypothetical protein